MPELIDTAAGCSAAAASTASFRCCIPGSAASTSTILACGATACTHSTSSAASPSQPPPSTVGPGMVCTEKSKQSVPVATLSQVCGRPDCLLKTFTSPA